MIWLTWRQFRIQALIAAAALAAFAVLLAVTGPDLASLYAASGISSCSGSTCSQLAGNFLSQVDTQGPYHVVYLISIAIVLIAPAVIGMFFGAPLIAREFETGTRYLTWNQSITRTRWLAAKLAVVGLAAMAVSQAFSLMLAWWAAPLASAVALAGAPGDLGNVAPIDMNQFSPLLFASQGITPLAYAAFAFALGVAAGVLLRRTVPAMAITLAIYLVFQVAIPLWIRPILLPADRTITGLNSLADSKLFFSPPGSLNFTFTAGILASQPGAWILSSGAVDAAGNPVGTEPAACLPAPRVIGSTGPKPPLQQDLDCLASHGISAVVTYQPSSRYWTFQGIEIAIYLALTLVLTGFCFWRLGRRTS